LLMMSYLLKLEIYKLLTKGKRKLGNWWEI
jgi:hypothetical protein